MNLDLGNEKRPILVEERHHQAYLRNAKQELEDLEKRIKSLQKNHEGNKAGVTQPKHGTDLDLGDAFEDLRSRVQEAANYMDMLSDKLSSLELSKIGTSIEDLRITSEQQINSLKSEGEARWLELQARAESSFWNLRASLQRTGEGLAPLLTVGEQDSRTRYYLQKSPQGRWSLQKEGADAPAYFFATKKEALKASRRYVRDQSPSELVVRRTDGTFERIHQYRM